MSNCHASDISGLSHIDQMGPKKYATWNDNVKCIFLDCVSRIGRREGGHVRAGQVWERDGWVLLRGPGRLQAGRVLQIAVELLRQVQKGQYTRLRLMKMKFLNIKMKFQRRQGRKCLFWCMVHYLLSLLSGEPCILYSTSSLKGKKALKIVTSSLHLLYVVYYGITTTISCANTNVCTGNFIKVTKSNIRVHFTHRHTEYDRVSKNPVRRFD